MIGKVFCKDDECDGDVRNGDGADIAADRAPLRRGEGPREGGEESEFGQPLHLLEEGEVDDLRRFDVRAHADERKDRREQVSRKDAADEGDHFEHLLAVHRADDGDAERHERADEAKPRVQIHHIIAACVR